MSIFLIFDFSTPFSSSLSTSTHSRKWWSSRWWWRCSTCIMA